MILKCIVNGKILLLGKMVETKYNMTFLVMKWQCWHHMKLMASTIGPMHLFVKGDQNEMQPDFFSHWTLFALASAPCHANGIVNSTNVFISSRQLKQCAT